MAPLTRKRRLSALRDGSDLESSPSPTWPPAAAATNTSSTPPLDGAADPTRRRKKSRAGVVDEEKKRFSQWRDAVLSLPPTSGPSPCARHVLPCVTPPRRPHSLDYHYPLLLCGDVGQRARSALLDWFEAVRTKRRMPWRKDWIDPRPLLGSHYLSVSKPGDDAATPNADNTTTTTTATALCAALERRAYEVWISEIMLQQTRVAVVADYWSRWTRRWPTIHHLAAATRDDVLSAWRGLGYYGRAARLHDAARLVVADPHMRGLLPSDPAQLRARVPGVGPYTAGAIAAIVYGRAAAMVDGNVIRVLSRQLGLLADPKSNKAVVDAIWAVAEALVQMVAAEAQRSDAGFECAHDSVAVPVSDRPGRWGQALMELGSTICTPKPNCEQCPITSTCRAYGEGQLLAGKPKQAAGPDGSRRGDPTEIEDLCHLCEPLEETEVLDDSRPLSTATAATNAAPRPRKTRRSTREGAKSRFFERESTDDDEQDALAVIVEHARRFPIKSVKKTLRQEDSLVCAIRRPSDGSYLIRRRPSKGQLAGLWELPNRPLSGDNAPPAGAGKGAPATNVPKPSTTGSRKQEAESFVSELLLGLGGKRSGTTSTTRSRGSRPPAARHVGELGCVPWQFSHLKLAMHVHLFVLVEPSGSSARDDQALADDHSSSPLLRWASPDEIEAESMGTGMRKCWELVTQSR